MKIVLMFILLLSSSLAYSSDFETNGNANNYFSHLKKQPYTSEVNAFRTDLCTMSPQSWIPFSKKEGWSHCCIEHDIAHWAGGNKQKRKAADLRLRQCIKNVKGPAKAYYFVVRAFGHPAMVPDLPLGTKRNSPWGFGWSYYIKHDNLTAEQEESVCRHISNWTATQEYRDFYTIYVEKQGVEPRLPLCD